jgi:hypothetical protein|uniref:Uncharacterized protein n=1 Tax=Siphoviridae sp. ctuvC1 TaxID=2826507 RepID=A0A8S5LZU0_9CAUD|nr:MAG TPA: hypothetical protein [Siphoviridae sp. ctuvC1]DAR24702.1 MAG TPA: hypothetical protein [Caudoviricetes sp.]
MTNFEKIKNMSPKEMAKFINSIVACCLDVEERADCIPFIEKWLNSEVEE